MAASIKLDLISDVVCPWCIIGYKRLQQAINELGLQGQVEITWQPFELNPTMPAEGEHLIEHIERKYGLTAEESAANAANITQLGAEVGFKFDFYDDMHIVNTKDAHLLLEYARSQGKQTELKLRLFDACFTERQDISNRDVLAQALKDVGLDSDEGLLILSDSTALRELRSAQTFWQGLGVSSVPTIVFNRESGVSGAQSVEVYKKILTELLEKS